MARTRSIQDEQILAAARDVFLEHGLAATTAEIARRANISEGTIFKRFETKDRLFFAAMCLSALPTSLKEASTLVGTRSVGENLGQMCAELIAFFEQMIPRMSMIMTRQGPSAAAPRFDEQAPPLRLIRLMTSYLDDEQRQGRLRADLGATRAEITARMLIAACHHYAFLEVSGLHLYQPMPEAEYIQGIVDHVLTSLGASNKPACDPARLEEREAT